MLLLYKTLSSSLIVPLILLDNSLPIFLSFLWPCSDNPSMLALYLSTALFAMLVIVPSHNGFSVSFISSMIFLEPSGSWSNLLAIPSSFIPIFKAVANIVTASIPLSAVAKKANHLSLVRCLVAYCAESLVALDCASSFW